MTEPAHGLAQATDPVGLAVGSIVVGAGAGGVLMCLVLAASYWMIRSSDSRFVTVAGLAGAGGLVAAAAVGAVVSRGLGTPWRRVIVATISVAAAALIGALTTLADMIAGKTGLLVLGGLCALAIGVAWRGFLAPHRGQG